MVEEQHTAEGTTHVDEVAVGADELRDDGQQFVGEAVESREGGVEEQLRRRLRVALGQCRALAEFGRGRLDEGRAVAAVLDHARVELRRPGHAPGLDEFELAAPCHHVVGQREPRHFERAQPVHDPATVPPRRVSQIDLHVAAADRRSEVVGVELSANVGDQRRELRPFGELAALAAAQDFVDGREDRVRDAG